MSDYKERLQQAFPVWSGLLDNALFNTAIVAGGAAGNLTVTGIKPKDQLVSIVNISGNTQTIVAGAAAGDVTVTGIATTDVLKSVLDIAGTDLTSEFSITAADTINNAGGTSSSGSYLIVAYEKGKSNIASSFTIKSDNTINNTGGTATTGQTLLVTWLQWAER